MDRDKKLLETLIFCEELCVERGARPNDRRVAREIGGNKTTINEAIKQFRANIPAYVAEENPTMRCYAAWESARDFLEEPSDDYPAAEGTAERRMQDDLRWRHWHRGAVAALLLLRDQDGLPSPLRHTVLPLAEYAVRAYPELVQLDALGNDRPRIDPNDRGAVQPLGRKPLQIVRRKFEDLSRAVVEDRSRVHEPPAIAAGRLLRGLHNVAARASLGGERLYIYSPGAGWHDWSVRRTHYAICPFGQAPDATPTAKEGSLWPHGIPMPKDTAPSAEANSEAVAASPAICVATTGLEHMPLDLRQAATMAGRGVPALKQRIRRHIKARERAGIHHDWPFRFPRRLVNDGRRVTVRRLVSEGSKQLGGATTTWGRMAQWMETWTGKKAPRRRHPSDDDEDA